MTAEQENKFNELRETMRQLLQAEKRLELEQKEHNKLLSEYNQTLIEFGKLVADPKVDLETKRYIKNGLVYTLVCYPTQNRYVLDCFRPEEIK